MMPHPKEPGFGCEPGRADVGWDRCGGLNGSGSPGVLPHVQVLCAGASMFPWQRGKPACAARVVRASRGICADVLRRTCKASLKKVEVMRSPSKDALQEGVAFLFSIH